MTRTMRSPRLLRSDSAPVGLGRPAPSIGRSARPGALPGLDPAGTGAPAAHVGGHGPAATGPVSGPLSAAPPAGVSNAVPLPAVPGPPARGDRPFPGPSAAVDAAAGDPVPRRHPAHAAEPAHVAPPRQRVPGSAGAELRAVPDTPAPGPRPAPVEPPPDGGDSLAPGGGADGPWVLVRSAQAGDMGAFSELFDRYYDVVFRYVLFRMNDRTLAEDITQETFLRALRRISSVTYQGRDIGAWFVTIARNLIFDHVKSSRYRLESTTSDIVELSPSTHGPEQQVLDLATNEELLRCVRKLNADQQECISLRFLQGMSVAETAKIMDRNEGAVKALQHRAVRRLAQLLPEGLR
jgi:RNA polymerase sigma-70 factor (ECF subfamily)